MIRLLTRAKNFNLEACREVSIGPGQSLFKSEGLQRNKNLLSRVMITIRFSICKVKKSS